MPKYTRKELLELIGGDMKPSSLRTYITRGKVKEDNGLIDSADTTNAEFIERQTELAKDKTTKAPKVKKSEAKPKAEPKKKAPEKKNPAPVDPEEDAPVIAQGDGGLFTDEQIDGGSTVFLDKAIKKTNIRKTQAAIKLDEFKRRRLEGKVIPTDMVKEIFAQHFKNVTDEFYQTSDNLVTMISETIGASRDEMVKFRSQLKKEINLAVKVAKEQSEKDIQNIVDKYSESLTKIG